jgi:hypothetical protein
MPGRYFDRKSISVEVQENTLPGPHVQREIHLRYVTASAPGHHAAAEDSV